MYFLAAIEDLYFKDRDLFENGKVEVYQETVTRLYNIRITY